MDLTDVPLFALADRRLAWVDARQALLAQNVANADTPGFHARDLKPFAASLQQAALGFGGAALARTDPGHLGGTLPGGPARASMIGEQAPDGNAVALDKELVKVADTDAAQELVTTLTKKYYGLVRNAIGR
jgi:flagellar basal-body rod protein FlgB